MLVFIDMKLCSRLTGLLCLPAEMEGLNALYKMSKIILGRLIEPDIINVTGFSMSCLGILIIAVILLFLYKCWLLESSYTEMLCSFILT